MTRAKRCGKLKKLLRQQEKHSQTTALFDKRRKAQQIETVRFDLRGGTAGKGAAFAACGKTSREASSDEMLEK